MPVVACIVAVSFYSGSFQAGVMRVVIDLAPETDISITDRNHWWVMYMASTAC